MSQAHEQIVPRPPGGTPGPVVSSPNNSAPPLAALDALEELRVDSKTCKARHFAAAERKAKYQGYLGVPAIVINLLVGSVLVRFLQAESPPVWLSAMATVLSFCAASLTAVQTFFNFGKMAEGHRAVANRYLEISDRCKNLLRRHKDAPSSAEALWNAITALRQEYAEVNREAEAFPTNKHDFNEAKRSGGVTPFR